jgi:hypothetical protein
MNTTHHTVIVHHNEETNLWTGECIRCRWDYWSPDMVEVGLHATDHELSELLKEAPTR